MSSTHLVTVATGPLLDVVVVPGSKSVANRVLVCAALADGTSTISNLAPGDDTAAMLDCLAALGACVLPGGAGASERFLPVADDAVTSVTIACSGAAPLPPSPISALSVDCCWASAWSSGR